MYRNNSRRLILVPHLNTHLSRVLASPHMLLGPGVQEAKRHSPALLWHTTRHLVEGTHGAGLYMLYRRATSSTLASWVWLASASRWPLAQSCQADSWRAVHAMGEGTGARSSMDLSSRMLSCWQCHIGNVWRPAAVWRWC